MLLQHLDKFFDKRFLRFLGFLVFTSKIIHNFGFRCDFSFRLQHLVPQIFISFHLDEVIEHVVLLELFRLLIDELSVGILELSRFILLLEQFGPIIDLSFEKLFELMMSLACAFNSEYSGSFSADSLTSSMWWTTW